MLLQHASNRMPTMLTGWLQVFTTHSGYGRLGAFMSGRYHQAYGIDFWKDSVDVPPKQRCGPKDYIKYWNV